MTVTSTETVATQFSEICFAGDITRHVMLLAIECFSHFHGGRILYLCSCTFISTCRGKHGRSYSPTTLHLVFYHHQCFGSLQSFSCAGTLSILLIFRHCWVTAKSHFVSRVLSTPEGVTAALHMSALLQPLEGTPETAVRVLQVQSRVPSRSKSFVTRGC